MPSKKYYTYLEKERYMLFKRSESIIALERDVTKIHQILKNCPGNLFSK
jgi:hypothetical protein